MNAREDEPSRPEWRVVVPNDPAYGATAAAADDWIEAWDDIYPGYVAQRFPSEIEAKSAARRLRAAFVPGSVSTFFDAATVPIEEATE